MNMYYVDSKFKYCICRVNMKVKFKYLNRISIWQRVNENSYAFDHLQIELHISNLNIVRYIFL